MHAVADASRDIEECGMRNIKKAVRITAGCQQPDRQAAIGSADGGQGRNTLSRRDFIASSAAAVTIVLAALTISSHSAVR
jgi:hypothetical protein